MAVGTRGHRMKGKAMAGNNNKGPRIVDALVEIARELRLANRLHALQLGASVLEHDKGTRANTTEARARVARRNALRAEVRAALGLDDNNDNDKGMS